MTLTPEQMDEAVKEMAKDFRPVTASDGSHTARFATDDEIRNGWKEPLGQALLAALPVIRRAVLEEVMNEAAAIAYQQDADHGVANTGGADAVLARLQAMAEEAR